MATVRQRILFSGRVQGVGFRYATCLVSRQYAVTGFVRNLPDGRVEVVAEGEAEDLARFQFSIEAEMRGYLRETAVDAPADATGEFTGFGVRY